MDTAVSLGSPKSKISTKTGLRILLKENALIKEIGRVLGKAGRVVRLHTNLICENKRLRDGMNGWMHARLLCSLKKVWQKKWGKAQSQTGPTKGSHLSSRTRSASVHHCTQSLVGAANRRCSLDQTKGWMGLKALQQWPSLSKEHCYCPTTRYEGKVQEKSFTKLENVKESYFYRKFMGCF